MRRIQVARSCITGTSTAFTRRAGAPLGKCRDCVGQASDGADPFAWLPLVLMWVAAGCREMLLPLWLLLLGVCRRCGLLLRCGWLRCRGLLRPSLGRCRGLLACCRGRSLDLLLLIPFIGCRTRASHADPFTSWFIGRQSRQVSDGVGPIGSIAGRFCGPSAEAGALPLQGVDWWGACRVVLGGQKGGGCVCR